MEKSVINAFQKVLLSYKHGNAQDFREDFAIKRFLKKLEAPDNSKAKERKEACFQSFTAFDASLRLPALLPKRWYQARLNIHHWMKTFRLGACVFTNGSEASPTHGRNSIEQKLESSAWECTPGCWELWADLAWETLAIKRMVRKRFSAVMLHDIRAIKHFERETWSRVKGLPNARKLAFIRKLSYVTYVREASRFSTVPKNNEVDRPIDLQPLCNMLVQRTIGEGLRSVLKQQGIDLDSLAGLHGKKIQNAKYATIDLKNASDSIHLELIRFLYPKRVYDIISSARVDYTEGPDSEYYLLNKVSSMGNGFTFELMSLTLYALLRVYTCDTSVFGDDIIIPNANAHDVITDLEGVGFVVNKTKSFINSEFRESCGFNYHDAFGYIESYDFWYPTNINDCCVIFNKTYRLMKHYASFRNLYNALKRAVPKHLQGDPPHVGSALGSLPDIKELSNYFWVENPKGKMFLDDAKILSYLRDGLHLKDEFYIVQGYQFVPKVVTSRRKVLSPRRHIGKYFMYLNGVRIVDDLLKGEGSWQPIAYVVSSNTSYRYKKLVDAANELLNWSTAEPA